MLPPFQGEVELLFIVLVSEELADAPGELAGERRLQRHAGRQPLPDELLGLRVRERDVAGSRDRDHAAGHVAQHGRGAALRRLERGAALAEVRRHAAKRGEHGHELDGRLARERRLALAAGDGQRRAAQSPDRLRQRARRDAAQRQRGHRSQHGREQDEHAEVAPALRQRVLAAAGRRRHHEAVTGRVQHIAKAEQRLGVADALDGAGVDFPPLLQREVHRPRQHAPRGRQLREHRVRGGPQHALRVHQQRGVEPAAAVAEPLDSA